MPSLPVGVPIWSSELCAHLHQEELEQNKTDPRSKAINLTDRIKNLRTSMEETPGWVASPLSSSSAHYQQHHQASHLGHTGSQGVKQGQTSGHGGRVTGGMAPGSLSTPSRVNNGTPTKVQTIRPPNTLTLTLISSSSLTSPLSLSD